jgi:PAS domain S-box-containing protein
MMLQPTGYATALWAAAGVSSVTACAAWVRRKGAPGGRYFAAMMAGVVLWCLMSGMEAASVGLPAKVIFSKLGYVGICAVAPLFLRFAAAYGGRDESFTLSRSLLLWTVPAATFALVLSNEWHHLVWTGFTTGTLPGKNVLMYGHGTWYWVWVGWYGIVSFIAMAILVHAALQCRKIYVRQTLVFLAGAAFPWIGEVLYVSRGNPFPGLDLPSIGFAVMGVLVLLGMSQFSLFDIVPVARTVLVERMSDGIIVLDAKERIVDINPAARELLGATIGAIGRPGDEVFTALRDLLPRAALCAREYRTDVRIPGSPPKCLDLIATPLTTRSGGCAGWVIMLRDVTTRRGAEEERERLVTELQTALADVRTLRGLLPICSSCKKIRDDGGYWRNLENYLQEHSEVHFSHGLCEECIEKLYPDLADSSHSKES